MIVHLLGHFRCCHTCRHKSREFAKKCLIKIIERVVAFGNKITNFKCVESIISTTKLFCFNINQESVSASVHQLRSINDSGSQQNNKPGVNTAILRIGPLLSIIVLCYARVTAFSFVSLSYSTLYGPSKDDSNDTLTVFRYDGTVKYSEHFYLYHSII